VSPEVLDFFKVVMSCPVIEVFLFCYYIIKKFFLKKGICLNRVKCIHILKKIIIFLLFNKGYRFNVLY